MWEVLTTFTTTAHGCFSGARDLIMIQKLLAMSNAIMLAGIFA
jgi:hypothetical protein